MKKIYVLILIAALILPELSSCRKGENDPLISLRSRRARLAGEWKVTSASGSQGNTTWTFDGATYIQVNSTGTYTISRTMEYVFEKDGSYTYTETNNGSINTTEGTWNFLEGIGDVKSKSKIVLRSEVYTDGWGQVTNSQGTSYTGIFNIVELRNEKMVLKYGSDYNIGGTEGGLEETIILEPK